ncbi:translation initiation factor [Capnocytophaga catalasegens]|uniref:Translation initiation factor n=1 Tax=Capnocytophaga catalasegens TaxID=1004260 RepID=A0AAV5AZV0_9FLAO|nr:translation initiation factor [Capnocytophaga catalasegens]GIZ14561.1 translation initiation factor [Capnocytophaga catalasegens]GJM50763.1 translation initiation factor [Capnocytophaga catalasegens]GJM51916.1 translation initiation factor [Capnocytophaga catalasegens]
MDLQDQLKKLFPDHNFQQEERIPVDDIWLQDEPLLCKYEKRNGKPQTLIEGYTGAEADFKKLTKEIKTTLGVGGSFKNDIIIIQGDYRDKIMQLLKDKGFKVKRVGG